MAIIIKSHKDTLLIDSTIGINYNRDSREIGLKL